MRSVNWDTVGEDSGALSRFRRRTENRTYKFYRTCAMFTYRQERGLIQPDYCQKEFKTNKEIKLTCCSFCSVDYAVRRKSRI